VAAGADAEEVIRPRHAELVEKGVGQEWVVVLTRMDEALVNAFVSG
jgi:hypothetical protein